MKQIILIHGAPSKEEFYGNEGDSPSNVFWFPWIQKKMSCKDLLCQVLEFPKPYDPVYSEWVPVFEQMNISDNTVLVGHSYGAGFLLKYLSSHPLVIAKKVILIAPWLDLKHELTDTFFDFEIDFSLSERFNMHIIYSIDDEETFDSVSVIKEKLPGVAFHEFTDRGHFCTPEFPELLELI